MEQHLFIVSSEGIQYRFPITSILFVSELDDVVFITFKNSKTIGLMGASALEFLAEYNGHFVGVA